MIPVLGRWRKALHSMTLSQTNQKWINQNKTRWWDSWALSRSNYTASCQTILPGCCLLRWGESLLAPPTFFLTSNCCYSLFKISAKDSWYLCFVLQLKSCQSWRLTSALNGVSLRHCHNMVEEGGTDHLGYLLFFVFCSLKSLFPSYPMSLCGEADLWRSEETCRIWFSLPVVWLSGIELRTSDLAASPFTH